MKLLKAVAALRAKALNASNKEVSAAAHSYPQLWLLITSFALFALYVAWDLNYLSIIFTLDRSYIASMIAALIMLSSGHAAWHIFTFSARIEQARTYLARSTDATVGGNETGFFIDGFLRDLNDNTAVADSDQFDSEIIIEIIADRLRSPVDLGWFMVDLAVRMGLVGTIIGFILIFTSLSGDSISGAEGLKDLLVSMSGGMGTALFTTLTGLVGATFLSFQYLILGREVELLIGLMVRIRNRYLSRPN